MIKSFEDLLLHFAQQPNTDDPNIIFQSPLLTVTTELVNKLYDYIASFLAQATPSLLILSSSVENYTLGETGE